MVPGTRPQSGRRTDTKETCFIKFLQWKRAKKSLLNFILLIIKSKEFGLLSCSFVPVHRPVETSPPSPPSVLVSAGVWFSVGQDVGQQGRDWVVEVVVGGGVASVQVQVQCGRGRRVQVVCGQEHPAGFSQQLQADSRLTLPLRSDGRNTQ